MNLFKATIKDLDEHCKKYNLAIIYDKRGYIMGFKTDERQRNTKEV